MKDFEKIFSLVKLPLAIVVILWAVEITERLYGLPFTKYGLFPRSLDGFKGIIFAPLIHGDWSHLINNSIPILVLGIIFSYFYKKSALISIVFIWLMSGFLVWIFAKPTYHIGASGVVYGMISFIFFSGIFRKNTVNIILALVVLILYSGYAEGLVPRDGISHESHWFGMLSGIAIAFLFKNVEEPTDLDEIKLNKEPTSYFFLPDTFDRTKIEHKLNHYFETHQRITEWRYRNSGF